MIHYDKGCLNCFVLMLEDTYAAAEAKISKAQDDSEMSTTDYEYDNQAPMNSNPSRTRGKRLAIFT